VHGIIASVLVKWRHLPAPVASFDERTPAPDARNAFAEHHGGVFPEQYYNSWYAGNQGRWNQENNEWRWERINGDEYGKGDRGWEWKHHQDRN